MLEITISGEELWDDENEVFLPQIESQKLQMEHSLLSISKWEAIWGVSFLGDGHTDPKHSPEMLKSYYQCMTINHVRDPHIYDRLSPENIQEITLYMNNPACATKISKRYAGPPSLTHELQTAETIYASMCALQIPFSCEKWHINKLLMLISVCALRQQDPKKMSQQAIAEQNHQLNAVRRAAMKSKG